MTRFADEEPDVDERPLDDQYLSMEQWAKGLCVRCGGEHPSKDCTQVTPDLLNDRYDDIKAQRGLRRYHARRKHG